MSNTTTETTRIDLVCKDCGRAFSLTVEEARWLEERGLKIFKRCSLCRYKRRKNNEKSTVETAKTVPDMDQMAINDEHPVHDSTEASDSIGDS